MKLYLSHSTYCDYKTELYEPLQKNLETKYDIFYPHDNDQIEVNSKDIIRTSDCIVAEVSHASTGQGIELGWANESNIPIVCLHSKDCKPSSALRFICEDFIEYDSKEDMVEQLVAYLASKN